MKDRFDLETEITFLYNFSTNLRTISEGVLEHNLSHDEIVNALEGVRFYVSFACSWAFAEVKKM